ncbi:receptor-type tyrosine-protein phosphatase U [Anguilla anguilla]|uniref:receptor-type tyrosine-protein phosphatase U n=1 Tax=Anguilla anguilla TaxID=7936 RepID=UPI0015AA95B8|nr:receptor-type tyrosine-protein phosphatase U [Anguilla anguilla]
MTVINSPVSTSSFLFLSPGSYMLVNASQHAAGQRAQLLLQTMSENDTHCVQFSYFLYSRDGHSPGALRAFVRVNSGPLGSPVWNVSGSRGRQWHQVELAVSTFWPNEYQVLFEATVSKERRGYIGMDDILLLNYPCYKAPHFSRLGDVEVNAGQNASFQCVASGRASEAEQFLLERHSGDLLSAAAVKHLSHRRFVASFQLDSVTRREQDLYRCVTQSSRGSGVSNFAELIVKVPPSPIAPPQLLRAGSTYLIVQLNTNSILGDGPIVRKEIEYRASQAPWSEVHGVNMVTYKLWHLDPDTEYHISVLLSRPGEGGTGPPGPPLVSRTKCAVELPGNDQQFNCDLSSLSMLMSCSVMVAGNKLTFCIVMLAGRTLTFCKVMLAGSMLTFCNVMLAGCVLTFCDIMLAGSMLTFCNVMLAGCVLTFCNVMLAGCVLTFCDIMLAGSMLTFCNVMLAGCVLTFCNVTLAGCVEISCNVAYPPQRGYSAKHEVQQFHFTSWPEHGVPYHATGLLAFIRRVKASTPPDAGPVVVHCSVGAGRTGCYIVLDVMLDMAECEGVVDIYNCVKTLCSRRINMIQTEEQYIFIHDAILEACLCGETAIPGAEFALTYKEMLRVDSQSNSSQLREEFQTLNSVTPHPDVEECSIALLPRNREKNRSMDVLPPDRSLAFLVTTEGESNNYINAALTDSFHRPAAFIATPHPLPGTTADFWRLVFDYGCTSVVMLNQLNQSNSAWPCVQYWPEPGVQQYGPMQVEFLSRAVDDDVITRLFRVQNVTRLQEGQLVVRQFQFLRWSAYRDVPDSKKAFLSLLGHVNKWQHECGEGRTIVHCLNGGGRSGTFCACTMLLEMVQYQNFVDVFYAVKTLRNSKPNMVESLDQYRFCYELALEYLDCMEVR